MLESRAHPALSGRLLILAYRGHRSGRTFSIPLRYAELPDGRLVTLALGPTRKLWWRSFSEPRDATLTLRGAQIRVVGVLADGEARDVAAAAYARRYPHSGRRLEDAALVVFARPG